MSMSLRPILSIVAQRFVHGAYPEWYALYTVLAAFSQIIGHKIHPRHWPGVFDL